MTEPGTSPDAPTPRAPASGEAHHRRTRQRLRRRVRREPRIQWRRWTALFAAVLLALTALTLMPALEARRLLTEGRDAMEAGRHAILGGKVARARTSFDRAESAFIRAGGHAQNPLLRLASFAPLLGRTPDAVRDLAEAGRLLARAGRDVSAAAAGLPGGIAALAPTGGTIALEPLVAAADPLDRASSLVTQAREALDRTPDDLLVGPVATAHDLFDRALGEVERVVHPAAAMAGALPDFLGAGEPRRYFFGAQNPAELRGTGGLIGAYSILRVREGTPRFTRFSTITTLNDPSAKVRPPSPDYAKLYGQFGAPTVWQNLNMSPHFPSAAVAIERLYRKVTGRPVDGVILVDPTALEALLEVTGPVRVPLTGDRLTAENAVPYLTNEAYSRFPDSATRKRLLGEAARAVFDRLLSGTARTSPEAAAAALVSAAARGHLLLHSAHPDVQRHLEEAGVSGALPGGDQDFLAVVANNAAGHKADYWARRRVDYLVALGPGGSGRAEAVVELTNGAPATGHPSHVIGPYSGKFGPGENVTYLSAYCAPGCGLERFERDGEPGTVSSREERDHPVFSTSVRLASGESQTLAYGWSLPGAWEGGDGRGVYELTVRGQTTIEPTPLRIEVRVPEGMRITEVSEGMRVRGDRAVWEGKTDDLLRFRVEFDRPPLDRIWRSVLTFLNRPLIRL